MFNKGIICGFGEIMIRLSPPRHQRFKQATSLDVNYGGAEANTIESLACMGQETRFFTRLPENELGEAVRDQLRGLGIDTRFLQYGGERLGAYYLEQGAISRGSKVIYDRANSAAATLQAGTVDWDAVLDGVTWFHWSGITPAISQSAADVTLEALQACDRLGVTVSVDLNHRPSLWQYGKRPDEIMPQLVELCDVIMADLFSVKVMLGKEHPYIFSTEEELIEGYTNFLSDLTNSIPKCKIATSTHRVSLNAKDNQYRGLLYNGKELFHSPIHDLFNIVDRIGGGDAFSAGLIYGLLNFESDEQQTVNFAAAASAIKHSIEGDFNLTTLSEIESIMNDTSGRVAR